MTDTSEDVDSEAQEEVKKPVKEVPVVQDQGFFVHDTGDTYDGFFEAKKKDKTAKMHGNVGNSLNIVTSCDLIVFG